VQATVTFQGMRGAMKFDHFTQKAREAILVAQNSAKKREHQQITSEHILWALLEDAEGIAVAALRQIGIDPIAVATELDRALKKLPRIHGSSVEIYLSDDALATIKAAEGHAKAAREDLVALDHLLLAVFDGSSAAADVLRAIGVR